MKLTLVLMAVILVAVGTAAADETCQSPFLPKVTGQEDYIYVWTLGIKGVADGNDSMVTVDANPASANYGTPAASSARTRFIRCRAAC
jgi:selenium-binding protein 1